MVFDGRKDMKNKKAICILLLALVLAVSIIAIPAIADAGNFSGSSDYGGSSGGDWGGGSDWDSGGYSSYVGDYGGSGSGGLGGAGVAVAVIIIVIVLAYSKKRSVGAAAPGGEMTAFTELSPMAELRERDENFSEAAMQEKISNLYIQMQQAWQAKDFEPMRPHMTDALFNQFDLQLGELVRANATNYVERIAVLSVELKGWKEDEVNDAVVAVVNTRIVDYTTDDRTGELISGSKSAEKFMTYQWTLIRSKGMKTPAPSGKGSEGTVSIHCPSCGAPLDINHSAKCPYCDSVINARDYDWAISAIKGLAQRTEGR